MPDLAAFPITQRWPAAHPDRLQLYSVPTPNGVKVSIMLEETGLPYEPHAIDFGKDEQKSPEFVALNPNGKIPAILDPDGPGGTPLALFESGAILLYLVEKTGKFLPADPAGRLRAIQWVMFQMGGVGPMFGQVGFFVKFAGKDYEDKRPRDRYLTEAKRLLGVMDAALAGKIWFLGDDYHRRHLDDRLGTRAGRLLRGGRTRRVRRVRERQGMAGTRAGATGGAARADDPGAGVNQSAAFFLLRPPPAFAGGAGEGLLLPLLLSPSFSFFLLLSPSFSFFLLLSPSFSFILLVLPSFLRYVRHMYPVRRKISPHAARLRRERTDVEDAVWQSLRNRQCDGFKFRFQSTIAPFVVDFLCVEARLIVELDGSQHGDAADAARTRFLEGRGYRVLRFWNSDVVENRDGVLEAIRLALASRMDEKKKTLTQPSPMKMGEG